MPSAMTGPKTIQLHNARGQTARATRLSKKLATTKPTNCFRIFGAPVEFVNEHRTMAWDSERRLFSIRSRVVFSTAARFAMFQRLVLTSDSPVTREPGDVRRLNELRELPVQSSVPGRSLSVEADGSRNLIRVRQKFLAS